MSRAARAFTLIELMIVVSIIGILASIAVPKFSDLVRKSREGATKGNLGGLRSALSIYYGDMEGVFPSGTWQSNSAVLSSLVPKYIQAIPLAYAPDFHTATSNVFCHFDIASCMHDGYGWIYDGTTPADSKWGSVWIACSHTDTKASRWTNY